MISIPDHLTILHFFTRSLDRVGSLVFQFGFRHFQYLISRLIYAGKQLSTTFYCICWRWHLINIVISLIFSLWVHYRRGFLYYWMSGHFCLSFFFNLLFNKDALTLGYSPRTYTYLGKLAARWCSTELKLQYSSIKGIKAPLIPVLLGKETSKELRIIPE